MKKNLLLASLAALSIAEASAQHSLDVLLGRHRSERRNADMTARLLQSQSATSALQKPTAIKQRVIAQALNPEINNNHIDSTRYAYSGINGSRYSYNMEELNYSEGFTSVYAPMFQLPGIPGSMDVLADSIIQYDNSGMTNAEKAFYRADKKIDSVIYRSTGGTSASKTVNVYNPQGHITATYTMQQAGADWDTVALQRFSYNSAFTQVTRDSSWFGFTGLVPREVNVYYYNAANQLDSFINWDLQGAAPVRRQGYYIAYNSGGKIVTIKNYDFDEINGVASLYSIDSLGYTPGVADFTFYETTQYEEDVLSYGDRQELFRNAAGLVDSVYFYSLSGTSPWVQEGKLRFAYNSYGNPETLFAAPVDMPVEIVAYRFYYETYDDQTSSVKPLSANQDFTVYPNPFANTINIDWKGRQQSDATVRLVNIMGQEVFQGKMVLKSGQNKLDIPAVTDGSYVLLIQDAAGKSWSTKMIKR